MKKSILTAVAATGALMLLPASARAQSVCRTFVYSGPLMVSGETVTLGSIPAGMITSAVYTTVDDHAGRGLDPVAYNRFDQAQQQEQLIIEAPGWRAGPTADLPDGSGPDDPVAQVGRISGTLPGGETTGGEVVAIHPGGPTPESVQLAELRIELCVAPEATPPASLPVTPEPSQHSVPGASVLPSRLETSTSAAPTTTPPAPAPAPQSLPTTGAPILVLAGLGLGVAGLGALMRRSGR